jgi:hypothetical protein
LFTRSFAGANIILTKYSHFICLGIKIKRPGDFNQFLLKIKADKGIVPVE